MSSRSIITCPMYSSYNVMFWGYKKGSRANSNWESVGIKYIKCYLPQKICLQCNNTLSVDFVVELPLSSGHDTVMIVVDSVSKRAHFIPTHTTVTVEGAARLCLHQVWKLHGLLKCVISDHGPQFIACFTKKLYRLLGIKLASSTA